MTDVIVGIHGLANKSKKETLETWWRDSIEEGLRTNCGVSNPQFDFVMVYWADLLYKYHLHEDESYDFDSLYNGQPYVKAKPGALRRYDDDWLDSFRATARETASTTVARIKDSVGLDSASEWLLSAKIRDLLYYWDKGRKLTDRQGNEDSAGNVLRSELTAELNRVRGRRIMLIAHSMGAVIGYDVLRDIGRTAPDFEVDHLVTIGAPLGLPTVKSNIRRVRNYNQRSARVRTPTIVVGKWVNYADRTDPISFDIHLSDDYGPNARGVRARDDLVYNDYVSPTGEKNSHKSYGYLRTPEASELIKGFIES